MDETSINSSWWDQIDCEPWINCSKIGKAPGANVIVPAITSITGIVVKKCNNALNQAPLTPFYHLLLMNDGYHSSGVRNAIAIIVLQSATTREQARTVFYVLVAALAWTDLFGILFTTWPVIIVYANRGWPSGNILCNYHAFSMISFALITPCIVCTMAVERYVGIRHGYFYKSHINRPKARFVLLVQWIVVLFMAAFPFFGFGRYSKQYPGTWCFLDMHPANVGDAVYGSSVAIINLIMIILIIICNIVVTGTLLRMRYKRTHENSPAYDKYRFRSIKQREIEIEMVILLIGITIVFTICWAPLMILINQFSNDVDFRKDILAVRLASINQILDPWVYILFRKYHVHQL
uniref:Thromboxane A2 receptor n=1 Tax=Strigamia maritima TaxID=126957 RepID=T1IVU8_STRMM